MDKKDYDLKLWSYIQDKSSFFDLPINKVTELLEKDYTISEGISKIRSLFPVITEIELEKDYKEDISSSGSESIIYWNNKDNNEYIYKLNDPERKLLYNKRFNEIIIYYVLQKFLFPKFEYLDLKIIGNKMFIRQKISDGSILSSIKEIDSFIHSKGYIKESDKFVWVKYIEDIRIKVYDLNENNCRLNGADIEIFDPALRIDYSFKK